MAVGSTFKVVDAIAALEEGVITPGETLLAGQLHRTTARCSRTGAPTATAGSTWSQAITQSADTYFYQIGYKFYLRQGTQLEDWANRLGLGKPTGIDIPGEVAGRIPTPEWKRRHYTTAIDKIWKPGDSILLSIGQGDMEGTPLQLATTYAAIANGGTIVQPHLGLKIVDQQGQAGGEPATYDGRAQGRDRDEHARRRPERPARRGLDARARRTGSSAATRSRSPARPARPRCSASRTTPGMPATHRPTIPSTWWSS